MAHIFISYSRRDQDYALRLADDLRQRGFDVWIDQSGLEPSDHWFREIGQAVRECAAFVIIKTPESEASNWVEKEILVALNEGKPIFPLLLIPCPFDMLVDVQHEDVTDGRLPPEGFYQQIARLVPPTSQQSSLLSTPVLRRERQAEARAISWRNRWVLSVVMLGIIAVAALAALVLQATDPTTPILPTLTRFAAAVSTPSATPPPPTTTTVPTISPSTPMPSPTTTLTSTPPVTATLPLISAGEAMQLASTPVIHNADWTPYLAEFDGVTMALVPVGSFEMGSSDDELDRALTLCNQSIEGGGCGRDWFEDEAPSSVQTFSAPFWIDQTEVTRSMYQQCVDDGGCDERPLAGTTAPADQPVNQVTWDQAEGYCTWREARLPTEAEWEYAARGPDSSVFPWGSDAPTCEWGNFVSCGYQIAPVGSTSPAGDSWVGAADMAGNVWEWTASLYDRYPYDANDGREDPPDNTEEIQRVLRGGGYSNGAYGLRSAFRYWYAPDYIDTLNGFRCVRSG